MNTLKSFFHALTKQSNYLEKLEVKKIKKKRNKTCLIFFITASILEGIIADMTKNSDTISIEFSATFSSMSFLVTSH